MIDKDQLIPHLISELEERCGDEFPDIKKPAHISILSEILDELELGSFKNEFIRNLLEGVEFNNPVLNKRIQFTDKDGKSTENLVGNLLRLPLDDPGRKAAERALPSDESERKEVMNDLGNENQPGRKSKPVKSVDDASDGQDTDSENEPETGTMFDGEQGEDYKETLPNDDPANDTSDDYIDDLPDGDPAKPNDSSDIDTEQDGYR